MAWTLRRVLNSWEVWHDTEKQQDRSLPFFSQRTAIPPSFDTLLELEEWLAKQEEKMAKNAAAKLLSGRNYPSQILYRKLVEKGFSEACARGTVEWAVRLGYVQDTEYLYAALRREISTGHGPKAAMWKLRSKEFSQEAISEAAQQIMPRDVQIECIRALLTKKKFSQESSQRQKTIAALLRRGFSWDTIQAALRNFF
ncbi:MAG: regulatory protein RecX [Parachlamydiales bacterium]|nr:regulatory protein RecX [Parachlamydiales bacterium]